MNGRISVLQPEAPPPQLSIGIVGGGFAGICLALHLRRYATEPIDIHIFEAGEHFGLGAAYEWRNASFLLNGEADHLSMYDAEPDGFVDWISSSPGAVACFDPERPAHRQFMPRFLFSDYVLSMLNEALREPDKASLMLHAKEAVEDCTLENGCVGLQCSSGSRCMVDRVVLATGNEPPNSLRCGCEENCVENPWEPEWTRRVPPGDVLLVGMGQTMIDACIALGQSGHRGRLIAVSRRGVRTVSHRAEVNHWMIQETAFPSGLLEAVRFIREQIRIAEAQGVHWSAVTDASRPLTLHAWKKFSAAERRRYFEHLAPYWWGYRQRVAPKSGAQINHFLNTGYLEMHRGRLISLRKCAECIEATIRIREGSDIQFRVQTIVNCTGPNSNPSQSANPLIRNLLRKDMICPHSTNVGLDITDNHEVIDRSGRPSEHIFAIGALARGAILEALAIRDIRRQSIVLTETLLRSPALCLVPR